MNRPPLWLALALAACADPPPAATPAPVGTADARADVPEGRSLRRMDIDQLKASIEQVTGGIGWSELQPDADPADVDLFRALSLTLGKPDYLDVTTEDLVPGLLFQKFLDDAAKSACQKLIVREQAQAAGGRVFVRHTEFDATLASDPAGFDLTIRGALLRFHGRAHPEGDPRLGPWLDLQDRVSQIAGPAEGWRAVCVALITHPDFYSY